MTRDGDFITSGLIQDIGGPNAALLAEPYLEALRKTHEGWEDESEVLRFLQLAVERGGYVSITVGYEDPPRVQA